MVAEEDAVMWNHYRPFDGDLAEVVTDPRPEHSSEVPKLHPGELRAHSSGRPCPKILTGGMWTVSTTLLHPATSIFPRCQPALTTSPLFTTVDASIVAPVGLSVQHQLSVTGSKF